MASWSLLQGIRDIPWPKNTPQKINPYKTHKETLSIEKLQSGLRWFRDIHGSNLCFKKTDKMYPKEGMCVLFNLHQLAQPAPFLVGRLVTTSRIWLSGLGVVWLETRWDLLNLSGFCPSKIAVKLWKDFGRDIYLHSNNSNYVSSAMLCKNRSERNFRVPSVRSCAQGRTLSFQRNSFLT